MNRTECVARISQAMEISSSFPASISESARLLAREAVTSAEHGLRTPAFKDRTDLSVKTFDINPAGGCESAFRRTKRSKMTFMIADILRPSDADLDPAFTVEGLLGNPNPHVSREDPTSPSAAGSEPVSDDEKPLNLSISSSDRKSPKTSPADPGLVERSALPAWIFCTRYSDRPSSGPRHRKPKRAAGCQAATTTSEPRSSSGLLPLHSGAEKKRPRTAFNKEQLKRLQNEFRTNRYLTETRRTKLAAELCLGENQVKIWFQNKRAKLKKNCRADQQPGSLAKELMAQGLYQHSTTKADEDEDEKVEEEEQRRRMMAPAAADLQ